MLRISRGTAQSAAVEWIYFPMAVLVVLLHTDYTRDPSDISSYLGLFISGSLVKIAVPTFFFLSGYLFYAKYETFGAGEYVAMLKKKACTLLIPYYIWNFIAYYGYGIINGFSFDVRPWELERILWSKDGGFLLESVFGYKFSALSTPFLGPLWFVRDLLVVMLFSPFIWSVVKSLKMWTLLLLGGIWQLKLGIPIRGFGFVSWCFFSMGAVFSIHGRDVFLMVSRYRKSILAAFLVLWGAVCFPWQNVSVRALLNDVFILVGIMSVFVVAYTWGTGKGIHERIRQWGRYSFFIYVFHGLFVFYPLRHLTALIAEVPWVGNTVAYVVGFAVRVLACILVYKLFQRICPGTLGYMVGGRVK